MQQRNFPMLGRAARLSRLPFARATAWNNQRGSSVTFRASIAWIAPAGARLISSAQGKGSDGQPESGSHYDVDGFHSYSQIVNYDPYGNATTEPEVYEGVSVGATPKDYCATPVFHPDGSATVTCYRYSGTTVDVGDYQPPAPGVAATAFNLTFAGGAPGAQAGLTNAFNIKIVPGVAYQIVVPPGGWITIVF